MCGCIKYFESRGKNRSFIIKDDSILVKYNESWNKIKKMLGIKFHSMAVYDKKYIKAKVGEFNCVIKTKLLGGEVSRESVHYTCIACVSIDSVLKMEKKNYPQLYLEEFMYKGKKKKISGFINLELESE